MIKQLLKVTFWLLGLIFFANILFLDFVWLKAKPTTPEPEQETKIENIFEKGATIFSATPTPTGTKVAGRDNQPCQAACLDKIQEEVEKLSYVVPATPSSAPARSGSVSYISIGSSGQTSSTGWTDISGTDFYFDLADYPSSQAVRWEVNMRSFASGNAVSARLYDISNSRAVDGSELSTTSGSSVLLRSENLTIWQGNNLYRIQVKTASGDTGFIDTARLKIQ